MSDLSLTFERYVLTLGRKPIKIKAGIGLFTTYRDVMRGGLLSLRR